MAYKQNSPQSVSEGGTGASTFTDGAVLLGSGTGAITALDVTAKGSILVGDGTTDPVALAVGTNDHVLTADSAEASGVKWAAAAGGSGDYVFIESATASNSTSIDFESLTSTYNAYVVVLSAIVPETSGTDLYMRVGTGGTPTYQTGSSDYAWSWKFYDGGVDEDTDNSDSKMEISSSGFLQGLGGGAGEEYNSTVTAFNPSSSSTHKLFLINGNYENQSSDSSLFYSSSKYNSDTAVTALRFYMESDTIESGEFRLYGISNT